MLLRSFFSVIPVRHKVVCPDGKRCFAGVDCYLTAANDGATLGNGTAAEVVCGDCPDGYYGDGFMCKPKCHNLKCKKETEYCSAPDTCSREFVLFRLKISRGDI